MRTLRSHLLLAWFSLAILLPAGQAAAQDIGRALEREYGVVTGETAERRQMIETLDRVVSRVAPAAGYHPRSVRILGGRDPRRDREINAMALPDGRIYVLAGLLMAAQDTRNPDASVAFVVGHELTHVVKKHSRKQFKGDLMGAVAGALLARALGAGDSMVRTASDLGSGLLGGHYSRQHEYEADRGGLLVLAQAGYPLDSAAEMMQLLLDRYGEDRSLGANWFASHPNTRNRVLRLQSLANDVLTGKLPAETKPAGHAGAVTPLDAPATGASDSHGDASAKPGAGAPDRKIRS